LARRAGGGQAMPGERFAARRKALGLSRRQLALLLGVSEQTIANWERGTSRFRWPAILELALDALEARLTQDDLLPPPPSSSRRAGEIR
jgi:transcriptional regulator with XRE-family HTH domain